MKPRSSNNLVPIAIERCTNMHGKLGPDERKRLLAVINNPTHKTWDAAYSLLVSYTPGRLGVTLWQAVLAVDPTFPNTHRVRWGSIPSQQVLLRALDYATKAPTRPFRKEST